MGARAGAPDARALVSGSAPVRAAVEAIVAAAEPGQRVALVGGVVRDLLRGVEPHEVDVVVEGDGIALAERLAAALGAELVAYRAFGTATVHATPPIDVVGARRETYAAPGALPAVEPASIEEDLGRRDVTVNAIAIVVAGAGKGELLDPFAGADDLASGALRLLRPDAFEEDATRLVRCARYAVRLGATPDATLSHAARAACHGGFVGLTGPTRMADALRLALGEADPAAVLALLGDWDALTAIEPGMACVAAELRAALALAAQAAPDADRVAIGLGHLLAGVAPDRRAAWLAAAGVERALAKPALAVAAAAALRDRIAGATDADVDAACAALPVEAVVAAGGDEAADYLGRVRHIALAVDGDDVRAATGAEGPAIGRLLADLRRARIAGEVADDRDAQLGWLAASA